MERCKTCGYVVCCCKLVGIDRTVEQKITDISKNAFKKINQEIDAHIIESFVSLVNQGVLEVRLTTPRHTFDKDNCKMTIEQSCGLFFRGQEKMIEMEKEIEEMKEIIMFYADKDKLVDCKIDNKGNIQPVWSREMFEECGEKAREYVKKKGWK